MRKQNFAIIGCGRISHKQAEGLAKNIEKAYLVAVCDIVLEKTDKTIEKYWEILGEKKQVKIYSDYKEMLEKEEIKIAIISTESGYHEEIALYCIGKGINIIVEKPLALSTEGSERIVKLAESNGVLVGVCHQNRFNQPVQLLKRAITEGRMGRIFNGTARVLWNRNMGYYEQAPWRGTWELDGGTLMNQCIHNIDLLNWMMDDDVDTVYAQTANFTRDIEGEDFGAIIIRYKSGKIGIVEGSAVTYPTNLEETLTVIGEKGTVVIGGIAVNKMDVWRVEGYHEEDMKNINCGDPNSVYGYGHTALFKDFIEALEGNRNPLICAKEGLKAKKIILAAYKSQKTGLPINFDEFKDFKTSDMKGVNIKIR